NGPSITIRKFSKDPFTAEDLIAFGTMSREMVQFLRSCVRARVNMIVSGGTGSGKTTTLNVLSGFIPDKERIVTIEDTAELQLKQPNLVTLESRSANIEGKGEFTIRQLVINSLRMRPDRIVIGEVRGGEALDMLQAMNTGHDGSLSTLHANSPQDALARLETMILMTGIVLPLQAIREQISAAIELVVQQDRYSDGSRKITKISAVAGIKKDKVLVKDIFVFLQTSIDEKGRVSGEHRFTGFVPRCLEKLKAHGENIATDDSFGWGRQKEVLTAVNNKNCVVPQCEKVFADKKSMAVEPAKQQEGAPPRKPLPLPKLQQGGDPGAKEINEQDSDRKTKKQKKLEILLTTPVPVFASAQSPLQAAAAQTTNRKIGFLADLPPEASCSEKKSLPGAKQAQLPAANPKKEAALPDQRQAGSFNNERGRRVETTGITDLANMLALTVGDDEQETVVTGTAGLADLAGATENTGFADESFTILQEENEQERRTEEVDAGPLLPGEGTLPAREVIQEEAIAGAAEKKVGQAAAQEKESKSPLVSSKGADKNALPAVPTGAPTGENDVKSPGLAPAIPPGRRGIALAVNKNCGLYNFLRPGDKVDVLIIYHDQAAHEGQTARTAAQDALVLAVRENSNQGNTEKSVAHFFVILAVTPAQAEALAYASFKGTFYLTLCPGGPLTPAETG
ncbi:MAG: Flp pilus assembly protein CpaB, partial [Firmicutes bacterium]|nr:Flp pilus assembly protein CpaB [Bacillota bacterium]